MYYVHVINVCIDAKYICRFLSMVLIVCPSQRLSIPCNVCLFLFSIFYCISLNFFNFTFFSFICLSFGLSVCMSVYLSIYLFVCLSVYLKSSLLTQGHLSPDKTLRSHLWYSCLSVTFEKVFMYRKFKINHIVIVTIRVSAI